MAIPSEFDSYMDEVASHLGPICGWSCSFGPHDGTGYTIVISNAQGISTSQYITMAEISDSDEIGVDIFDALVVEVRLRRSA